MKYRKQDRGCSSFEKNIQINISYQDTLCNKFQTELQEIYNKK